MRGRELDRPLPVSAADDVDARYNSLVSVNGPSLISVWTTRVGSPASAEAGGVVTLIDDQRQQALCDDEGQYSFLRLK